MKVAVAQLNPVVGDVEGNLEKAVETISRFEGKADLLVFPELFLAGYPPRDLLKRHSFIRKTQAALRELVEVSGELSRTGIVIGAPVPTGKDEGAGLYNSAFLISGGEILAFQHKSLLPTYDFFDETRYFDPAPEITVIPFRDQILGISICEDAWNDPTLWPTRLYSFDPIEALAKKGATLLINISASPFHLGKEAVRFGLIRRHARKYGIPFVYVNQVGGNDELIFDGSSLCIDGEGNAIEIFPSFDETVGIVDLSALGRPDLQPANGEIEFLRKALVLGIRDYAIKCGFSKAVVGLSGGIDSAVTCCLAAEALGGPNVLGVSMPSPYTSTESRDLSIRLAENLGIEFEEIFISEIYRSYVASLKDHLGLAGEEVDVTLENIQARIRGNVLMAISNRFGHLVLSTGNKSEIAVGYCTLYGDLSGGLAAISDVPKTMVYRLAEQINRNGEMIPTEIIRRPPSAELKPDQMDQDTLPPYDVLDSILHHYVEEGLSAREIIELGYDPETVNWVAGVVKRNEYKRKQVPPGLKVTTKAFGTGRRMPIAAGYED
jgi:NAD+ synthase (glutamine-hydrolysing)